LLRLNQLYFRNYFLLFFGTIFMVSLVGYFLLEKIEISNHKMMLQNMINQFIISTHDIKDSQRRILAIKSKTSVRVTIVDLEGHVLDESDRKIKGMENHLHRPEIQQAQKQEFGESVRYSVSIDTNMLYVAKKYQNYFIRMSFPLNNIKSKFLKFWFGAIGLFSLSMLFSIWISVRINRRIKKDLFAIMKSLENMLNKKYELEFDERKCCSEFNTIAKQISKVSKKLEKREKQKTKYAKNLKALSKKQSDIISAIGHEFKNPISAVIGYAQSVKDDQNLSLGIRDKFLDKVINNANKISMMINRLSMAIKFENDTITPELTDFNLAVIAHDVKDMLTQKYKDRNIIVAVEDVKIQADRVMIENVLTNLIENALKYSDGNVLVRTENNCLVVIDSGIGIDPQDVQNITKRFYRVDSLKWDNSIGVGLYIVEYILKVHRCELQVESTPGVGSKFYFDLQPLKLFGT